MRRDSIFYVMFKQNPGLLFELLGLPPEFGKSYRFDSIAVKAPKFEIDGVFLPIKTDPPGILYYAEVQMQKDEFLCERVFSEVMLHFYQNRRSFSDWRVVIIYPRRSIEQKNLGPYEVLLNSQKVHRIYLNELGKTTELPLGLAVMQLTIATPKSAPKKARQLVDRAKNIENSELQKSTIDLISTIMIYMFTTLSRQEVNTMLGITLQETRVYQEAYEEGREEGREEGLIEVARQMLQRKLDIPTIIAVTNLSLEKLQILQKEEGL